MRGSVVARSVALVSRVMLLAACNVGPFDTSTSFGGPVTAESGGDDAGTTSHGASTGAGASGTMTQGTTGGGSADETATASGGATTTGAGTTSQGSSDDATGNASSPGTTGEPVCDAFCNGCACPSDMCTMCCAGLDKVDVCQGGSCFCF